MYKCCIFDLDGTLLNTIKALQKATNLTMERFGLGPLSEEQIQSIVGDGYKMQMDFSQASYCTSPPLQNTSYNPPASFPTPFHRMPQSPLTDASD